MYIYIIRHAATGADTSGRVLGRVDEPILHSETEALKMKVSQLREDKIDLVLTSPLLRARQSAKILAEGLNVQVRENEHFIERDFGLLNGLTWEEFCNNYPEEIKGNKANYQPDLKGAETITQVEERVRSAVEDLRQMYNNRTLLIVTHSGVIRIILREFGHLSIEESRNLPIRNLDVFKIELPDQ